MSTIIRVPSLNFNDIVFAVIAGLRHGSKHIALGIFLKAGWLTFNALSVYNDSTWISIELYSTSDNFSIKINEDTNSCLIHCGTSSQ